MSALLEAFFRRIYQHRERQGSGHSSNAFSVCGGLGEGDIARTVKPVSFFVGYPHLFLHTKHMYLIVNRTRSRLSGQLFLFLFFVGRAHAPLRARSHVTQPTLLQCACWYDTVLQFFKMFLRRSLKHFIKLNTPASRKKEGRGRYMRGESL